MDIHSGTGNGYVVQYTAHFGLTPSQVSNITINYVAHSTGAGLPDNTGSGAVYVLMSDGQWDNAHASYYISASDTTYTYAAPRCRLYGLRRLRGLAHLFRRLLGGEQLRRSHRLG